MKWTISIALAFLSTIGHAAPHIIPAQNPTVSTEPKIHAPDATLDSSKPDANNGNQTWTVIVDNDDPRTLSELFVEMDLDEANIKHVYKNSAFRGFAGTLSDHCVTKMSTMSAVKIYEPEMKIELAEVQSNAPWGLQRISEGPLPSIPFDQAGIRDFAFKYEYDGKNSALGKNVDLYVVDTGINVNHVDFDGRARIGFTVGGDDDSEGHGTHCAGTAASTTFGLAKAANIIGVKVLGGPQGSSSDILKGIDWMINNHDHRKGQDDWAGSVASMSLGAPSRSNSLDEAVKQASANGIHFSVAAGNENQKACNSSPAGVSVDSNVIAVGAIAIDDTRATFSNYGRCATVFAPGKEITSTWIGSNDKINTLSGTSMACPHVAGLIAYLLGENPGLKSDTAGMKNLILSSATDLETDRGTVKVANNGVKSKSSHSQNLSNDPTTQSFPPSRIYTGIHILKKI